MSKSCESTVVLQCKATDEHNPRSNNGIAQAKSKTVPSLYLSTDLPFRVLGVEDTTFENVFGFKTEEIQRSFLKMTGPSTDMSAFKEFIACSRRDSKSECNLVFYKKNGDEFICDVIGSSTFLDGAAAILLEFKSKDVLECEEEKISENISCGLDELLISSLSCGTAAEIDPAVIIHMKAVQRAVQAAARRDVREQGS